MVASPSFQLPDIKDLRSPSIPYLRSKSHRSKYPPHLHTPPAQLNAPYCAFTIESSFSTSPTPFSLLDPNFLAASDPLLQQLHDVPRFHRSTSTLQISSSVRLWTKRDRFRERYIDIYPLRTPHHYGRCRRCHEPRKPKKRREVRREVGWRMGWEGEEDLPKENLWDRKGGEGMVGNAVGDGDSGDETSEEVLDKSPTGDFGLQVENAGWELLSQAASWHSSPVFAVAPVMTECGDGSHLELVDEWEVLGRDT